MKKKVLVGLVEFVRPYILHAANLHSDYKGRKAYHLSGKKPLVIATNHGTLKAPG